MSIHIRKAEPTDCTAILEISSQIWEGTDYIPKVLEKWLSGEGGVLWCALIDNKVGGFARSTYLSGNRCWLEGIRVGLEARGKGLGKALATFQLQDAFDQGFESCGLSSYIENYESLHIIKTHGFEEVARFKCYDWSKRDQAEKHLEVCEAEAAKRLKLLQNCQIRRVEMAEAIKVLEDMATSELLEKRNEYLSYDWTFEKYSVDWVLHRISAGDFYHIETSTDSGYFSLSNCHVKGQVLTLNYVSKEALECQAIAFGIEKVIELGYEGFGYMAVDHKSCKAFQTLGFETYHESPQDVFVFEKKGR